MNHRDLIHYDGYHTTVRDWAMVPIFGLPLWFEKVSKGRIQFSQKNKIQNHMMQCETRESQSNAIPILPFCLPSHKRVKYPVTLWNLSVPDQCKRLRVSKDWSCIHRYSHRKFGHWNHPDNYRGIRQFPPHICEKCKTPWGEGHKLREITKRNGHQIYRGIFKVLWDRGRKPTQHHSCKAEIHRNWCLFHRGHLCSQVCIGRWRSQWDHCRWHHSGMDLTRILQSPCTAQGLHSPQGLRMNRYTALVKTRKCYLHNGTRTGISQMTRSSNSIPSPSVTNLR